MVSTGIGASHDADDTPGPTDIHRNSVKEINPGHYDSPSSRHECHQDSHKKDSAKPTINQHRAPVCNRLPHNTKNMGCEFSSRVCKSKRGSEDCNGHETGAANQVANANSGEKYRDSVCEARNSHDIEEDENRGRFNNHGCILCPCSFLGGRNREQRRINLDAQDEAGNTCQIKIEPENFPSPQTPENVYSFGILRNSTNDPSKTKVLLCTIKEDATWVGINAAVDKLGFDKETANTIERASMLFQNTYHSLVLIDVRSRNFDGEKLCKNIRALNRSRHAVLVAIFKKSLDKDTNNAKALLAAGFNRVLPECSLRSYWMYKLTEIHNGEVSLHSVLAQNEAICAAVEKSRDYIMITNKNHIINYMNKSCLSILGYTVQDVINKPIRNFDQLSCADQIMRHLDRGFEWEGKVAWKCKNGDVIHANCKASPHRPFGKEASHYIYVHENPQLDSHIFPRGSICSVRKGSYDLKSLTSEGAQSARRQSLAKLNNLPLEAPITKVISLITKAQENSNENVSQVLDKVVDILRTTELYSSHVKSESIKFEDPVTSDLIGALITPGPVPPSYPRRRSSNDSTIKAQVGVKNVLLQLSLNPPVKDVLENPFTWDFDIFKLERLSLQRPLSSLGMNILLNFELPKTLNVDERVIQNWLIEVERNYYARNPYHNSTHAADVLQAIAVFLKKDKVRKLLDEFDSATCLIAAITHDIGHPGRSSAFLCNCGDPLAILYNDISVLESHHASFTFKLTLSDDKINIFKGLNKDTYQELRQSVVDMILATEMTKHFEHLAKFVSVYSKPQMLSDDDKASNEYGTEYAPLTPEEERKLMKRMMIKCADVANPTRPLRSCIEWARRIAEEYFQQTDEEKTKNLPIVMPMFDRPTCNIPKSQIGFVDYIVNDMFEAWDAFVGIPEIIQHMRFNYTFWKTLNDRGITSMSKVYCPEILDDLPTSPRFEYLQEISETNYLNGEDCERVSPQIAERNLEDENQTNEGRTTKRHSIADL